MPAFTFDIVPQDAIAALDRRTDVPQPTFSWLDVWQQQHSTMFTVAKSAGFDVLGDISDAVDSALKNGETFDTFRQKLTPILQDKGWWGGDLGSARRLQIIFDTNMRMSYAAGRWAAIDRVKQDRPYIQYVHTTALHPRAEHLQWDGVTLPVDDPFWDTHYPPNGWGCKCSVRSLSQRQYDAAQEDGSISTDAPDIAFVPYTNKRTGQTLMVPAGIDPGFGYNVGKSFLSAIGAGS